MSPGQCIDRSVGGLLAAYELRLLADDEVRQFEVHVMRCDHCLHELQGFQAQASVLRGRPAARELVTALEARAVARQGRTFRGQLWPPVSPLLRPGTIWLLVGLLLVPAYHGVRRWRDPGQKIRPVQTLHLVPNRSLEANALDAGKRADGVISFVVPDARPDQHYVVAITREDGTRVVEIADFDGFDARGSAAVMLPHARMEPGRYRLLVREQRAPQAMAEYRFRIE